MKQLIFGALMITFIFACSQSTNYNKQEGGSEPTEYDQSASVDASLDTLGVDSIAASADTAVQNVRSIPIGTPGGEKTMEELKKKAAEMDSVENGQADRDTSGTQ